jgi:TrpR-related protein YerC/YecD
MKHHDQSQKYELSTAALSLCQAISSLRSSEEAQAFLDDLCTPAEFEALIDRWRVAQLLDQGKPYREISELTEVSVTTIGRVARFMEMGTGGYRTVLDRMKGNTQGNML